MGRTLLILTIGLTALIGAEAVYGAEVKAPIKNYPAITGDDGVSGAPYFPSRPGGILLSPGDSSGWTQYDYQTNGSTGNRVKLDNSGAVHMAWTNAITYPSPRRVYYNYFDANGESPWPGQGTDASLHNNDGYCQVSSTADGRGVIAYHQGGGIDSLFLAVDTYPGLGIFNTYRVPNRFNGVHLMWPYVTVSRTGDIHVVATPISGNPTIGYTKSTDGGPTWSQLQGVDSSGAISVVITSSPVSDKVAIIYIRSNPDVLHSSTKDICYIQSLDGNTWDFPNGRVNVTNYGGDDDSLSAGSDLDGVYDFNDNLHIIWNAHWELGGYYYYLSWLYHYSQTPGTITEIIRSDSLWLDSGCDFGGWNWHFCKNSVAVQESTNFIFVEYTDFDTSDCSAGGYANGDLYVHYSSDGGATWSARQNVTNSQTPGCAPGDCESDNWSSMAEIANANLHIFYVNDKDAGGIPQTEGTATDNPMLYLRYPVSVLDVGEDQGLPITFTLSQNYPNPFNAQTAFRYNLSKAGEIRLGVYDLLGRKIATLASGHQLAGEHTVVWDASAIPSGVYFYRLTSPEGAVTKKMTLLK